MCSQSVMMVVALQRLCVLLVVQRWVTFDLDACAWQTIATRRYAHIHALHTQLTHHTTTTHTLTIPQARAVRRILAHRLPTRDSQAARAEWYQIVEGEHPLWRGLSDPYKHTIRAFLVHFHTEILLHSSERFDFANGSIGVCGGGGLWLACGVVVVGGFWCWVCVA